MSQPVILGPTGGCWVAAARRMAIGLIRHATSKLGSHTRQVVLVYDDQPARLALGIEHNYGRLALLSGLGSGRLPKRPDGRCCPELHFDAEPIMCRVGA